MELPPPAKEKDKNCHAEPSGHAEVMSCRPVRSCRTVRSCQERGHAKL